MTTKKRDWVRTIGITGVALVIAGGLTMGGLMIARSAGLVSLPTHSARMMGGQMGRGFGMNQNGGMHGARHRGQGNGMMDGFGNGGRGNGMMDGFGDGGRGMMDEQGSTQAAGDERIMQHLQTMLLDEQRSATALGITESAAQAIAATRSTELSAIQALQTQWYPAAQAATASSQSSATTIDELRQEMLHHSQVLEKINAAKTFEHPELAAWITRTLANRATEITTLYAK
jgi:hypothetical protein